MVTLVTFNFECERESVQKFVLQHCTRLARSRDSDRLSFAFFSDLTKPVYEYLTK